MTISPVAGSAQGAANTLRETYRRVMDRVGEAAVRSGRTAEHVHVVAVTKYASMDQVRQLVELGHADLGENHVQQLAQRVPHMEEFLVRKRTLGHASSKTHDATPPQVRWHMIGNLQRNKVKQCVPLVNLIHSVDTLRIADELHSFGARYDRVIDVLMQVNISGETTKYGVAPPAVLHLLEQLDSMMHLRVRGLMTMAPHYDHPEQTRGVFARCRELFEEAQAVGVVGDQFNLLSMGMTEDFEVAIEEGSNLVRIGRAFFGEPQG
jgi:hypothetical protein